MKRLFSTLSFVAVCMTLFAVDNKIAKVTDPAPTAASLGIFGNIPVGSYTGIPTISIPIYTVKNGDIEVPIELKYHSSGIKVSQEASWVGLGWALNAGGAITRTVCGEDDFSHGPVIGYYYAEKFKSTNTNALGQTIAVYQGTGCPTFIGDQTYNFYENIGTLQDGEPDIFQFNFNGMSGKFYFRKKLESNSNEEYAVPVCEDFNNFIIKYFPVDKRWEITDDKGYKYYFQSSESSISYSATLNSPQALYNESALFHNGDLYQGIGTWYLNNNYVTTAWYLDRIESPKGNVVTFEYDVTKDYRTQTPLFRDEEILLILDGNQMITNDPNCPISNLNYRYSNYYYSRTINREIYLNKINFNGNSILFNTSDRNDIRRVSKSGYTTYSSQKLDNIVINDHLNNMYSKFVFNYSYFGSPNNVYSDPTLSLRLKLDNLQQYNNTGTSSNKHQFEYNEGELPLKNSNAIDHWGYFNNNANNIVWGKSFSLPEYTALGTKLPTASFNGVTTQLIKGANRESNELAMQHGILTAITYPTGGKTRFKFEANSYKASTYNSNLILFDTLNVRVDSDNSLNENTLDFELKNRKEVIWTNQFWDRAAYFEDGRDDYFWTNNNSAIYAELYIEENGSYRKIKEYRNYGAENLNQQEIENVTDWRDGFYYFKTLSIILESGKYRIKVKKFPLPLNDQDTFTSVTICYEKDAPIDNSTTVIENKIAGGLRIKEITNESEGNINSKKYCYEKNGYSTGRLMSFPVYFYRDFITDNQSLTKGEYVIATNNGYYPMSYSAAGSSIGYSEVTELFTNNDKTFKNIYYYRNEPDNSIDTDQVNAELNMLIDHTDVVVPGVPQDRNIDNGQILMEETYDSSGVLIQSKEYDYEKFSNFDKRIVGLKVLKKRDASDYNSGYYAFGCYCLGPDVLKLGFYYNKCETYRLKSIITKIFNPLNDPNGIEQITTFGYNNLNLLQNSQTNYLSDGRVINQQTFYPKDFVENSSTTNPLFEMVKRNMINVPILNKTIVNSKLTNLELTTYNFYNGLTNNSLLLPDANYKLNLNAPVSDFAAFTTSSNSYVINPDLTMETSLTYNTNAKNREIISPKTGITTTYLWSYNGQYPVAEIYNATYTEVTTALSGITPEQLANAIVPDMTKVEALRTALPNAQISTYTYKPLVGMTSATDPRGVTTWYDYDEFNRLKEVYRKDSNGAKLIITQHTYNYKH